MNQQAAFVPRKVLGEGTFGIVVGPALPNRNKRGHTVYYPRNVTKIFKTARNRNEAIRHSRRLKRTVGELEATAKSYRRSYRLGNLNASIRSKVKKFLGPKTPDNSVLSLMRTPFLGSSIYHIDETPEEYRALRNIPYQILCAQMLQCMKVVQAIHAAKYIHGDIRETNVLCHLDTGALTIIDFDWLKPFDDFYKDYPIFFYPHPPEALFIWGRDDISIYDLSHDKNTNKRLYDVVKNDEADIYLSNEAAEGVTYFATTYMPKLSSAPFYSIPWEKHRLELFNIAKDYIDSYGLAHSFTVLLKKAWYITDVLSEPPVGTIAMDIGPQGVEAEHRRFLQIRKYIAKTLLPNMLHSNYTKRWNIATAIREFTAAMERLGMDVSLYIPVEADLEFMREFADFHLVDPPGAPASPVPPQGPPNAAEMRNALNQVIAAVGNGVEGGRRRRGRRLRKQTQKRARVRKTVKNARSTR